MVFTCDATKLKSCLVCSGVTTPPTLVATAAATEAAAATTPFLCLKMATRSLTSATPSSRKSAESNPSAAASAAELIPLAASACRAPSDGRASSGTLAEAAAERMRATSGVRSHIIRNCPSGGAPV